MRHFQLNHVVVTVMILLLIVYLWKTFGSETTNIITDNLRRDSDKQTVFEIKQPDTFNFDFIPDSCLKRHERCDCGLLFSNVTKIQNLTMSNTYTRLVSEFLAQVRKVKDDADGHSYEVSQQYSAMHYLASFPFVKTVCETGFNAGHSSFNYLTANNETVVHSFDIGNHPYAYTMANYLKEKNGGRMIAHFGNSMTTIPKFRKENPSLRCDIMFVDGAHNYPVASQDVKHFVAMANRQHNVIIFDDYPTCCTDPLGRAWNEFVDLGKIVEVMRCSLKANTVRGFSIGVVS